MVKRTPLLLLLLLPGCVVARPGSTPTDQARIAVAECFIFSTFLPLPDNGTTGQERVAPTQLAPCLSARRDDTYSAPGSLRSRRRFFARMKTWKSKN